LTLALCFFLVPLAFAADSPDPADPPGLAEPLDQADPAGQTDPESPALPEAPAGGEYPADAEPAGEAPESEEPVGENQADAEPAGEAVPSVDADPESGGTEDGEDWDALPLEDSGIEMTVYYDERTGTDYVEIRTADKIEEYHYLSHIRYSDLIFVLSDLLRRITREGYQWAKAPAISYEKNEEVALVYRRDLVEDIVYGIVQFPDFKVLLSALREPDEEHPFNAENGRDMMTLVFAFASCLAQAEQTLGIKQLEYTMQFFRQD
jgi:hypothetical protein